MLLFLLLVLAFSIPTVQSWAAQKTVSFVNDKYKVNIELNKVRLGFDGSFIASDLQINDHQNNPMIMAAEVATSVFNFRDLLKGNGQLTNAELSNVFVNVKVYKGEDLDNLRIFTQSFILDPNKKQKKVTVSIGDVRLNNGHFVYTNCNLKDEAIVDITKINLEGEDFLTQGRHTELESKKLSFLYNDALQISNMLSNFYMNDGIIDLKNLQLNTAEGSVINGNLKFTYNEGELSDFKNKVQLKAAVERGILFSSDLKFFYGEFGSRQKFSITTQASGTLNNLSLANLQLYGLSNSAIVGNLQLYDSFSKNVKEDFKVAAKVSKLQTSKNDLESLLPRVLRGKLPEAIIRVGQVNLVGALNATPNSVNVDGKLYTDLGTANLLMTLSDFDNPNSATYTGNVNVFNFDLGTFLNKEAVGYTTFDLNLDGRGFSLSESDTFVQGSISAIEYKDYTYQDISVSGKIKDPVFNGELQSNDPNFDLSFNGLVNVNEAENDYDFSAEVRNIDFNAINLFKRDSISNFKGNITAKLKGTTVDNAYGSIRFRDTEYINQNDTYAFTDFEITSSFDTTGERTLKVNSPDILEGEIKGKFRFKNLENLFKNSFNSLYKNYEPEVYTDLEYVNFDLKIYNKIVDVFFPNIKFDSNTFIKGSVSSDESKFKIDFQSPKIDVFKNSLENIVFQIDNTNPLYNAYITIDKFNSERYPITDFSLLNVSINDTLYVRSEFKGGLKKKDDYDLNFFHTINEEKSAVVGIQKSIATIRGNRWFINEKDNDQHLITFSDQFKQIEVDSILINNDKARIALTGSKKDALYKNFKLNFSEVALEKITPTLDSLSYEGLVNGNLSVVQKDGAYYPESNISIQDFVLNEVPLGTLEMNIIGNEDLSLYTINSELIGKADKKLVEINGNIIARNKAPTINLNIDLDRFKLEPFSPLGGIVLSNLRGDVSGRAIVTGNYKNPDINGSLRFNNAGLKFPYLNVDLNIKENSRIQLSKKDFRFINTSLTDSKYNTKAVLNGAISHSQFKNWNLDLNLKSDRLLVLNTTAKDNDLYYGTAFIDGSAAITGPTDQLNIAVAAASSEGTQFKIPLSDAESVGDNSFIHFITPEEKLARQKGEGVYFNDVKGLELQFELDLNKNAEVEVVIDPVSGSTLKGYGAGTLLIEINTNGKFNMWGDFVAYQGTYDFKYGGILSKRFNVRSGGSINWNGSPTGAVLNLSAVYNTQANPAILLENSFTNRKIDVDVVTTLQGELLQPDLSFDIEFPTTSSVVQSELDYLLSDRTTKERQALSLVTQGQFYSDEIIGGGAITGNLVERASSLVNSIFSDEEDKFKVGLDYVQGDIYQDREISDQVGVSLTTQISNRILINGKVGVPVGGVSESVVVGDVRIDFLLSEDGSLRATIFNKQNDIQFIGEADGYTQGVGLSYSIDFNTFKGLIKQIFTSQKTAQKSKS